MEKALGKESDMPYWKGLELRFKSSHANIYITENY